MSGVAGALGWFLAGLLLWTAVAKLRRPARTADAFAALGLPAAPLLAVGVPLAELATAALLLAAPQAGAGLAVVLLAAFTAFLAGRLRGGAPVACGCFGSARPEPLTGAALLRNGLLLAAGLAILLRPPTAGAPPLEAVLVAGALVGIGVVAVALVDLRARIGRLWDNRLPTGPEGLG